MTRLLNNFYCTILLCLPFALTAQSLISTQPTDTYVCTDSMATFSVGATGTGLTYQWQEVCPGDTFTNYTTADGLLSNDVEDVFVANGNIYVATNGGGLGVSSDGGNTWISYTTVDGLASNNLNCVHVENGKIYVGAYSGLSVSSDGGLTWVIYTMADGLGENIVRGVHVSGDKIYLQSARYVSISTDGGITWTSYHYLTTFFNSFINCIYENAGILYVGTGGGLHYSLDNGTTWNEYTSLDNLGWKRVEDIYIENDFIYLASDIYGLTYSYDGGTSWINIPKSNIGNKDIHKVNIISGRIYLGSSSSILYYSEDGGMTWNSYSNTNGIGGYIQNLFNDGMNLYVAGTYGLSVLDTILTNIPTATSNSYNFTPSLSDFDCQYQVVVTDANALSETSNRVNIILDNPIIHLQANDQIVCEGDVITFAVNATSLTSGLNYQWQKITNGVVENITGANSNAYSFIASSLDDANQYQVLLSNANGCSTLSNPALLTLDKPNIVTHPSDITVCEGEIATFRVEATSLAGGLTYQWQEVINGVAIDIGVPTLNTFSLVTNVTDDNSVYQVKVSDANNCEVISNQVTLTVHDTLFNIVTQPQAQLACENELATFNVGVNNSSGASLNYQWETVCIGTSIDYYNNLPNEFLTFPLEDIFVDKHRICLAIDGGGLFISYNNGSSWINHTSQNGLASNYVRTVFVKNDIIYVGTRDGLSISNDEGLTWSTYTTADGLSDNFIDRLLVTDTHIYTSHLLFISRADIGSTSWSTIHIAYNPYGTIGKIYFKDEVLYQATSKGLYNSTDNGDTWNYVAFDTYNVFDISIEGNSIFLATGTDGIQYSHDNGNTWSNIPTSTFGTGNIYTNNVLIYKGDIYLTSYESFSSSTDLYISEDNGNTWSLMNTPNTLISELRASDGEIYTNRFSIPANDNNINGANTLSYSFIATSTSDDCGYRVIISDTNGCQETSDIAQLELNIATPIITTQPTDQVACAGDVVTFNITAASIDNNLTYQWQTVSNGIATDINGADQDTYTFTAGTVDDGLTVRCVVSSDLTCLIESDIVTLTLDTPTISQQPIDQIGCEGNLVTYSVAVSSPSGGELYYQWQTVNGGIATDINGANQPGYTFTTTAADDGLELQVVVTSNTGCTLLSSLASLTLDFPVIIQQPQDQTICEGDRVDFTVTATSLTSLNYQWQEVSGGIITDIIGANQATYCFDVENINNGIQYQVIIRDVNNCSVTSTPATLTVQDVLFEIDTQPSNQFLCEGGDVILSTSVINTGGNLSYQWQQVCMGTSFTHYIAPTPITLKGNNLRDVFVEKDFIYVASGGNGISVSSDEGVSWITYTELNGLASNFVNAIFVEDGIIYAVTYNGLSVSYNGGNSWINYNLPSGLVYNGIKGAVVSGENIYFQNELALAISNDNGNTWTYRNLDIFSNNAMLSIYENEGIVYIGTVGGLYYSSDNGLTWNIYGNTPNYTIYDIVIDEDTIYLASFDWLFYSEDSGINWTYIPNPQTGNEYVLEVSVLNGTIFIGGDSQKIYFSSDRGDSWDFYDLSVTGVSGIYGNSFFSTSFDLYVATTYGLFKLASIITDIIGNNTNTYTFTPNLTDIYCDYQVIVSDENGCYETSEIVSTMIDTSYIISQPSNQIVCEGEEVSFNIVAESVSDSLTYQWQSITGGVATDINGANQSIYTFTTTTADNGLELQVLV